MSGFLSSIRKIRVLSSSLIFGLHNDTGTFFGDQLLCAHAESDDTVDTKVIHDPIYTVPGCFMHLEHLDYIIYSILDKKTVVRSSLRPPFT